MIFIVLKENLVHSVWDNRQEAIKQLEVLRHSGYKELVIEEIEGTIPVNGQYYI